MPWPGIKFTAELHQTGTFEGRSTDWAAPPGQPKQVIGNKQLCNLQLNRFYRTGRWTLSSTFAPNPKCWSSPIDIFCSSWRPEHSTWNATLWQIRLKQRLVMGEGAVAEWSKAPLWEIKIMKAKRFQDRPREHFSWLFSISKSYLIQDQMS